MCECTKELVEAIAEQTKAISALVESNRELMDYMVGSEAEDREDGEPETYMDGSPVQ